MTFARISGQKRTFNQLKEFRRIELRVPPSFRSKCRQRKKVINCKLSHLPYDFTRLLVAFRGSKLLAVELKKRAKNDVRLRFEIRGQGLRFQEAVLGAPPIWVPEVGPPRLLMGGVQEQTPFRPFPIESSGLPNRIPDHEITSLPSDTMENKQFNRCHKLWKAQSLDEAFAVCADLAGSFDALACGGTDRCFETVDVMTLNDSFEQTPEEQAVLLKDLASGFGESAPESEAARRTYLVLAELLNSLTGPDDTDYLPETSEALDKAEKIAPTPLARARYALLSVDVLERLGYVNRAEALLSRKLLEYQDREASVYFLAAQARILMHLGEYAG